MKFIFTFLFVFLIGVLNISNGFSQAIEYSKEFRLGSPNSEPGGKRDVVLLDNHDFVTLSKISGSAKKTTFALARYNERFESQWSVEITAESSEEYKDLFYNGKDLVLLTVVHLELQSKTSLNAYGYDPQSGTKRWAKELETYQVGKWEDNPHKGKVKETFLDVICEHTNAPYITPFEYKHHLCFSPDGKKFVSYVYNYGERALTAYVNVYDISCNKIKSGKVGIDNDYTSYGLFINNKVELFILNANNGGKVNFIKLDLDTKDFSIIELPANSAQKDDFHVQFLSDDKVLVGNTALNYKGAFSGVMYSVFDFISQKVEKSIFKEYDASMKAKHVEARKAHKSIKDEENWLDYDLTHVNLEEDGQILFVLEKRSLHAEGYPHIARGTFDKSHVVSLDGHVQAEGIILMSFNAKDELAWYVYHPKNQVYPAADGLNSISFALDNMQKDQIRLLYAYSEGFDASLHNLHYISYDRNTGKLLSDKLLPNQEKLVLVRDYTLWPQRDRLVLVGRKGLLGKTSVIVLYKL